MVNLGNVRVGERHFPIILIECSNEAINIHFQIREKPENDYWFLFGSDGSLVFRSAKPRDITLDYKPGDIYTITWTIDTVGKQAHFSEIPDNLTID